MTMTAEIIQFVPKPNPDRNALIRQARANYESVFPTVDYALLVDVPGAEYVPPESDPA